MGGSSADFKFKRRAKLLAGFIVYVILNMLICYDSWVLGTARIKPVPEVTRAESDPVFERNEGLPSPSKLLYPDSQPISMEFPFVEHYFDEGAFPFLEYESASLSPDELSFRETARNSESTPSGFLYWEELQERMITDRVDEAAPADAVSPDAPRIVEKSLKFKKGDNFYRKAVKLGLQRHAVIEIIGSIRKKLDLRSIAVGDKLILKCREGASDWFELAYEKKNDFRVVIAHEADGYSVTKAPVTLMPKLRTAEGIIENSLYMSARKAGLSPGLILKLVKVFSWDVDFLVDLRKGDSFKVVYESWYRDGEFVRDGIILAARFVNSGRVLDAFWFQEEDGREGYFDREGRNLRKAFLRSPLQYRRISSSFSYRRFHPILKEYRPHLGIDYAAPSGTPVQTIGDGKVIYRGWKSGFGRFVKIRHNNGIISCYGHLRAFAKGLKTGKKVKQGQLIGWVGQSGLATGPHLDFRMIQGGRHVNPLKVLKKSPPVKSLSADHRPAFEKRVSKYGSLLESGSRVAVAK